MSPKWISALLSTLATAGILVLVSYATVTRLLPPGATDEASPWIVFALYWGVYAPTAAIIVERVFRRAGILSRPSTPKESSS